MALKKRPTGHKHYTGNKKSDAAELSALLAPLEEHDAKQQAGHTAQTDDDDTIVLDTGELKLPKALMEEEDAPARMFGLEPVILVILILALAFIAFIAYLISQTPAPAAR
jgi:hypothetical protein